jgi:magnesium-transporting ATPase (P-type)
VSKSKDAIKAKQFVEILTTFQFDKELKKSAVILNQVKENMVEAINGG